MTIKSWLERRQARLEREAIEESSWDDTGKTRGYKIRRSLRDAWGMAKPYVIAGALVTPVYFTVYQGAAQVTELEKFDVNHDGIEDSIVVYPIKDPVFHTEKGLVGYLDGKAVKSMTEVSKARAKGLFIAPPEYNVTALDFHPIGFQLASSRYNRWEYAGYIFVDKFNATAPELSKNGKIIKYLYEGNDWGPADKIAVIEK
jgi:hypothetical protein